ncbi:actin-like ATPase domain-containing protein [Lindgomyces ingoldianus]|uniref:Actin-like ATPase domain-containing protein n=1 Tax=Lindgomyces ingoldianus TaxID=673940 RepID=A0ACB6R1D6_9PLEO|nr:actin-like ATPase domain-containing protein [Lindgomyces ingoldianus]KAF2473069.1 actin-like ATPase domain-containing protein [Lindgomyces ingoldianus]
MDSYTEESSVQEQRLVIGLDYGTTFTGVAYATPLGATCPLEKIDPITDWGEKMDNHDKVPSVISYSQPTRERKEAQWGSDLSPGAVTMVHTKLELVVGNVSEELDLLLQSLEGTKNLNFQHVRTSTGLRGNPEYPHKSPEEIVTEYLTKVFEYLEKVVKDFSEVLRRTISTDIVITVPTEWYESYRAMNATYRAATKAGFSERSFPRLQDVLFVTEAEAAAFYAVRYLRDTQGPDFLKENACFVLCDAGGGTVDVVSYEVKQLEPLQLAQIGYPTGRKCGSIFINLEFKKWLRELIGDKHYQKLDPHMEMSKITSHAVEGRALRELMKNFNAQKEVFTKNYGRSISMDLPAPLENLDIPGKVNHGEITISCTKMEQFFDVCVDQVVDLITGHMYHIEQDGGRPKNVFLVGGFGRSPYLREEIKATLETWDVNLPDLATSWTAVVRGAVLCGIEKSDTQNLLHASSCRHHYGISVNQPFSAAYFSESDRVVSPENNIAYAQAQMIWMLKKGDLVLSNKPRAAEQSLTVSFSKTDDRKGKVTIYRYSEKDPPERLGNGRKELTTACVLTYDLSDIPLEEFDLVHNNQKKLETYNAELRVSMSLNGSNLKASIWWRNKELATDDNIMY